VPSLALLAGVGLARGWARDMRAGIAALEGPREPVLRMVKAFAERREFIVDNLLNDVS